jgi:uncharacterized protein with FMN-binding domain
VTLAATAIGLVLLFSFKTPDSPTVAEGPGQVAIASTRPGATLSPSAAPTQRSVASGSTSAPTASPSAAAPSAAGGTIKVDGDVVGTRFGDVQVRLIESNGKITDVQALQLPFDRRRSNEISQFAEPILRNEALHAQSAQIDTVSGATYTSDAYDQSLQSAIDRAGG